MANNKNRDKRFDRFQSPDREIERQEREYFRKMKEKVSKETQERYRKSKNIGE